MFHQQNLSSARTNENRRIHVMGASGSGVTSLGRGFG